MIEKQMRKYYKNNSSADFRQKIFTTFLPITKIMHIFI